MKVYEILCVLIGAALLFYFTRLRFDNESNSINNRHKITMLISGIILFMLGLLALCGVIELKDNY